jgi:alpha-L-fucosidase 2
MKTLVLTLLFATAGAAQHPIDQYNVVWNSPGAGPLGSMPAGNGDIGLNVWVEENGDLLFYIGKTDAWSETVRLLKLGRIRVRLSPSPFVAGQPFKQTLNLRTGEIVIQAGNPESETRISIWVDALNPAIRVEAETKQPSEMQAIYERWRTQQRLLEGTEAHSAYGLETGPEPLISYGDSIHLDDGENSVVWYHRNTKSAFPSIMKLQGLAEEAAGAVDPLLNRTFGARMQGENFSRVNATMLRSSSRSRKHGLDIFALTAIAGSPEEWLREIRALAVRIAPMKIEDRRASHEKWWQDFWDRSYVRVTGGDTQQKVSQGYALQRFLNACGGRGAYPIKSNGSIFTVDTKVGDLLYDADYRRWGGAYWFQNTRLVYWPMLASGDFDMMQPFFRMFAESRVVAQRRTGLYFNHEGLYFPSAMYFWGAYTNTNYGARRETKAASFVEDTHIRNYFSHSLELLAIMLEYSRYRDDKQFVRAMLAPMAEGIIEFYDKHYERDADGRIRFAPAQSLETWQDVINPLPEIAGLKYVLDGLLAQKVPVSKQGSNAARRILQQLPAIPTKEFKASKILAPAERVFGSAKNRENAELYAIFPYRIYGVDKPGIDLARATFENRAFKDTGGWRQDAIHASYLGLAEAARDFVARNFSASNPDLRFPAFWGPNLGWSPDQDHGNVAMMALQSMLLQSEGDTLLAAPAWPRDWDVEFKLHAPDNTVVEGAIRGGKIERLKTIPEKRLANLKRFDPQ